MKRYYLSRLIEKDMGGGIVATVPAMLDIDPVLNCSIEAGSEWALVVAEAKNHSRFLRDDRIKALPDFPMDGKVNAMHQPAKTQMEADLVATGFGATVVSSADGYRDVIRGIGRSINPNFDENNFDVAE